MLKPFCGAALAVSSFLILADCGGSTAPQPLTPAQIARHIDSLSIATRLGSRYSVLYVAENGPADDVAPASIVVTTGSGPHEWRGFIMRYVAPEAGPADSNYDIVAYSDYALTDVLWAETRFFHNQVPATVVQLLTSDTVLVTNGSGTATQAMLSAGGACELAARLENYPALPPGTCVLATFTGSLSWSFPNASAEFQTISVAAQTFTGLSNY